MLLVKLWATIEVHKNLLKLRNTAAAAAAAAATAALTTAALTGQQCLVRNSPSLHLL